MIYIIGDSHVSVFSGTDKTFDGLRHIQPEFGTCYTLSGGQLKEHINRFEQKIPFFCPIKIGSNTAYNSHNKLPRIEQVISEYGIADGDYVFLCFGEIDIRNHIGFNCTDIHQGIKECVDRYMKTVLSLKGRDFTVGVYAPPASSVGGTTVEYGDVILRNTMTKEFNTYLRELCIANGVLFKDISTLLMAEDGSTDESYIMDDIHLSQKAMPLLLKEFADIISQ
jgi:lysophospholipase L1-like esterase